MKLVFARKTIENDIPITTYRQTRTNVENVIQSAIQFKIRKFTCQHYITLRFVWLYIKSLKKLFESKWWPRDTIRVQRVKRWNCIWAIRKENEKIRYDKKRMLLLSTDCYIIEKKFVSISKCCCKLNEFHLYLAFNERAINPFFYFLQRIWTIHLISFTVFLDG